MAVSSSGPSDAVGAARELVYLGAPSTGARGGTQTLAAPWWFTGEDKLRLVVVNSLVGVAVTLQGRFLARGGVRPDPFVHTVVPSSDRMASTFDRPLGEGFLLNCSLIVTSGAPLVGQTYVMLQVIRGSTGATIVLGCLLAGYVTAMQHIAYPGSPIESSIAGGGYMRSIVGTAPAAGQPFAETVPAGARWELLALRGALTTSAVVGDRFPILSYDDGTNFFFFSPIAFPRTAASGTNMWWAQGMPHAFNFPGANVPLGLVLNAPLVAGSRIQGLVGGMDAGDQWAAPIMLVREWLEAA